MDIEEKISVIVPIYNVEKYLEECLNSIINQTYQKLEIILIDDASTDRSLDICRKFKNKDRRIKLIINRQNKGVAYCRNTGIRHVTSKYVIFVDSDDYINTNMIKKLYNLKNKYTADISMCKFNNISDKSINNINDEECNEKVLEKEEKFNILYDKNQEIKLCAVVIWNKLYNIDIFKNIKYPSGSIHEDEMAAHLILNNAKKIVFTTERLYNYRKREGSITSSEYTVKRQDILDALIRRYYFFKKKGINKLASNTLKNYCYFIIKHYKCSIDYKLSNEVKSNLMNKLKAVLKDLMLDKHIYIQTKLMIISFYFMPNFVIKVIFSAKDLTL